MIRATETYLKVANDDTKVMTGHGPLAKKADIGEFNAMLKTARQRVQKMFDEGKSEAEVIAARPLRDLDATWAASDEAAVAFLKMVYNSFKRS
jgi:cyclase